MSDQFVAALVWFEELRQSIPELYNSSFYKTKAYGSINAYVFETNLEVKGGGIHFDVTSEHIEIIKTNVIAILNANGYKTPGAGLGALLKDATTTPEAPRGGPSANPEG